jgi:PAS domain S-box-containing protein
MIGVGGLVALLMAAFVWQTVERQRDFLMRDGRRQSVAMARMLASNSVSWVLANDLMGLSELIKSAQHYPNLQHVMIVAPDARVLAHSDLGLVGEYVSDPDILVLLKGAARAYALTDSPERVNAIAPIEIKGSTLGWVLVEMNQRELLEKLNDITRNGLLYALAAIALGALVVAGIVRGLMRGLTDLVWLTGELAAGNASVRARVRSCDELGALNNAFNAMAIALDDSHAELRESELKYREIFDNVSESLFLYEVDAEGGLRLLDMNPAAEQLRGVEKGAELGKTLEEIGPPDFVAAARPFFRSAVETGQSHEFTAELTRPPDVSVLAISPHPVRDVSGGVYRLIVFIRDITRQKRGEEELHRREEEFRALVEHASDPIFRYDRECRRIYANPAVEYLVGRPLSELLGSKPDDDLILAPKESARLMRAISQVAEMGLPVQIEMQMVEPTGEMHYYQNRLVPEWGRDGEVATVLSISMDVTRLVETERSLLALVENLPDMVGRFDRQGRCLYANPMLTLSFNAADNYLGRTVDEIGPAETRPLHQELLAKIEQAVASGEPNLIETPWPLPHGVRDFEVRQIPEKDDNGKVVSILSVGRDITERKQAEREIAALNDELRLHFEALKEANKELESFSYSVSHDLKIPVRAIDGYVAILMEEYGGVLASDGCRYLNVVRKNAARMLRLIDGLLEFISLSQRRMTIELVDMGEIAREAFDELRSGCPDPERDITLRVGDLPPALCDRDMIHQVMSSLISNAIKFTGPRAQAVIEIGNEMKDGENAYYVRDNGVGFDMRYMNKLFGVFLRLHAPDEFEGPGVGLAIVKRIISRHKGRVWAESKEGESATFHFSLPDGVPPARAGGCFSK